MIRKNAFPPFITLASLMLVSASFVVQANDIPSKENKASCNWDQKLTFDRHQIFDTSDPDTIFLHKWANFLHIKTKPFVLNNESAFFIKKCHIEQADLDELERHLRQTKYLRDARVTQQSNSKIKVTTWDNWSLMPTVDFGRKGGENKFAFGIRDRNLLGLGVNAELEYFSNAQRKGYKFDTKFPLFMGKNITGNIRLINSDDGSSQALSVKKSFVSFDTKYGFTASIGKGDLVNTIFQNGTDSRQFNHKTKYAIFDWGWLHQQQKDSVIRLFTGFHFEESTFSQVASQPISQAELPYDRSYIYPYIGVEYVEKKYKKLNNVRLIDHIEDFNLGWHLTSSLGIDPNCNNSNNNCYFINGAASTGVELNEQTLVLFALNSRNVLNDQIGDRLNLNISTEVLYRFAPKWSLYLKNENTFSNNQYKDDPITLGGDTGLRGFPLQYQQGKQRTLFTNELRYYPNINLYKLFNVGAAVFWDIGKAHGKPVVPNIETGWLQAFGIGARFYSPQSSEGQVVHLDFAFPQSNNANVNNFEVRISTKHAF